MAHFDENTWSYNVAKAGDTVTGDIVGYGMNCLPPVCMRDSCSQVGEPWDHVRDDNGKWRGVYATFRLISKPANDGRFFIPAWSSAAVWEFCGACFAGETINRLERFEPTRVEAIA